MRPVDRSSVALAVFADELPMQGMSLKRKSRVAAAAVRVVLPMLQSALERARPEQTRLRLIGTLFGRASNVLMVALAALICGSTAWARGGGWLTAFIAAVEVVMLLSRCGVILAFEKRRRAEMLVDPDPWLAVFGTLAIGSSLSWGALCFLCLAFSHDPVLYVIPVLSTVGTAGAVAARNSGVPRLAKIQLACSLIPILPGCMLADDHGFRLLLLLVPAMAVGLLILIAERNQQLVELIETQAELARLSQTDALTQLPNRRYFDARLEAVAAANAARCGASFALLMADVDGFKAFNDRYGHPAGDVLLCQIAGILKENLSGENGVVARYGGEEFAILLSSAEARGAAAIAERLRQAVQAMCGDAREPVTISIGLAIAFDRTDPGRIMNEADNALYLAKRGGRNRVAIASPIAGLDDVVPLLPGVFAAA